MGPKTTAALVQVAVYVGLTTAGISGYMIWKHKIKKDVRKDVTIEQQDDVISNHAILDQNKSEDRVAVEDEARTSNTREQLANERLIRSQARALTKLEQENAKLKAYADSNSECLRQPWPDELRVIGGNPIRGAGEDTDPGTK